MLQNLSKVKVLSNSIDSADFKCNVFPLKFTLKHYLKIRNRDVKITYSWQFENSTNNLSSVNKQAKKSRRSTKVSSSLFLDPKNYQKKIKDWIHQFCYVTKLNTLQKIGKFLPKEERQTKILHILKIISYKRKLFKCY